MICTSVRACDCGERVPQPYRIVAATHAVAAWSLRSATARAVVVIVPQKECAPLIPGNVTTNFPSIYYIVCSGIAQLDCTHTQWFEFKF